MRADEHDGNEHRRGNGYGDSGPHEQRPATPRRDGRSVQHEVEVRPNVDRLGSLVKVPCQLGFQGDGHCSAFRIASSARSIHGPTEPGRQSSKSAISFVVNPP